MVKGRCILRIAQSDLPTASCRSNRIPQSREAWILRDLASDSMGMTAGEARGRAGK